MSPILLGLVLAAPVSVWTSRARYGKALARRKILATPEELNPPPVIRLADAAKAAVDPALDAAVEGRRGIIAAVVDPYVNGVHVSLLEYAELTDAGEALAERCLAAGPGDLSKNELSELLYLAPAMLMMHRAVWLRSAEGIHAAGPKPSKAIAGASINPSSPNRTNPNHPMLQINPDLTDLVADAATGLLTRLQAKATITAAAPGRVNLIGEHIDYCDGFVMPFAIDRYIVIAGCANGTTHARITDTPSATKSSISISRNPRKSARPNGPTTSAASSAASRTAATTSPASTPSSSRPSPAAPACRRPPRSNAPPPPSSKDC